MKHPTTALIVEMAAFTVEIAVSTVEMAALIAEMAALTAETLPEFSTVPKRQRELAPGGAFHLI